MKRHAIVIGVLLLAGLLILPAMSFAQTAVGQSEAGKVTGKVEKPGRITPEQKKQLEKLQQKFREDNGEALKQLSAKRFDLKTLLNSEKPDLKKAKQLQKEISDITAPLDQKNIELFFEVRAIDPQAKFGR